MKKTFIKGLNYQVFCGNILFAAFSIYSDAVEYAELRNKLNNCGNYLYVVYEVI